MPPAVRPARHPRRGDRPAGDPAAVGEPVLPVRAGRGPHQRRVLRAHRHLGEPPGQLRRPGVGGGRPGGTLEIDAGPVTGPGIRHYALTAPPGPPVSDKLVPREGAWWSSYPGQAPGDVAAREAVYGRKVDILHRYHDWNDTWPTAEEHAYAAGGRFLFEGWESRVFGGATMCWTDIAAGVHDAAIDAQAERLAAFGRRLFVGFMH